MSLGDKILNSMTGSHIKTIRVNVNQLANIIYEQFVPYGDSIAINTVRQLLKGKFFGYTDADSPNGRFHLHISFFKRGLTVHRVVWVKDMATEEVFEWRGYTLGPLQRAFEARIRQQATGIMPMQKSSNAMLILVVLILVVGVAAIAYAVGKSGSSIANTADNTVSIPFAGGDGDYQSSYTAPQKLPTQTPEPTENYYSSNYYTDDEDEGDYYNDDDYDDDYYDDEDDDYYDDDDDYDEDDDYEDEYILPQSDTKKLTKSDLKGLSKEELRLARNEIYARHGRKFQDEELQDYFDSQSWYVGTIEPEDFVDSEEMTKLEIRNAKYILQFG